MGVARGPLELLLSGTSATSVAGAPVGSRQRCRHVHGSATTDGLNPTAACALRSDQARSVRPKLIDKKLTRGRARAVESKTKEKGQRQKGGERSVGRYAVVSTTVVPTSEQIGSRYQGQIQNGPDQHPRGQAKDRPRDRSSMGRRETPFPPAEQSMAHRGGIAAIARKTGSAA